MVARHRSWWQKIKQHPFIAAGIIVALLALIVLIIAVVLSNGTGFNGNTVKSTATETTLSPQTKVTTTAQSQPGKTLWDLFQLLAALAIPVVVGFGAAWFTAKQGQVSEAANTDNQREAALQTYIDKMSELILAKDLRKPQPNDEVRDIARARTLTVLSRLDGRRKSSIIQFLEESHLIELINLSGANLSETFLEGTNLSKANLSRANLSKANLTGANLDNADLSFANLRGADLSEANLCKANLSAAKLSFAILEGTKLVEAKLMGTDMKNADMHYADLSNADLSKARVCFPLVVGATIEVAGADLRDADLTAANLSGAILAKPSQLEAAKSLQGATMPDGSIHP